MCFYWIIFRSVERSRKESSSPSKWRKVASSNPNKRIKETRYWINHDFLLICNANLVNTNSWLEIFEIYISSKFSYGNHDLFNTGDVNILMKKKGKFIFLLQKEIFNRKTKYSILKSECHELGLNQRPLDLHSNALPTAPSRLIKLLLF